MTVQFRASRSDDGPGRELLAELNALFNSQYPGRAARPGSVTTPDEMSPPGGRFLVGYEHGRAVAIGGVRALRCDAPAGSTHYERTAQTQPPPVAELAAVRSPERPL